MRAMSHTALMHARDTIAAIATPPGHGGVGIVRLSGPAAPRIAEAIAGVALEPRHAHYARFRDAHGALIDEGIALYFAAPRSYTGEDVVELQAHGSPAVLAQLLDAVCALGARRARAGEFTERAFLEGRLDLTQAEAVADLIAASDLRAARAARRALDGEFSRRVDAIAAALLHVRIHCEAAIDFADEPLDTLGGGELHTRIAGIEADLQRLLRDAESGRRLRDGLHAVIVGAPNVGKSSLLNALACIDRAIVTELAGTTRDTLIETVRVEGVEMTLVDTAGLRDSADVIEREGMRRTHGELQRADLALVVFDARDAHAQHESLHAAIAGVPRVLWIANKCDLLTADSSLQLNAMDASETSGSVAETRASGASGCSVAQAHVELGRAGVAAHDERGGQRASAPAASSTPHANDPVHDVSFDTACAANGSARGCSTATALRVSARTGEGLDSLRMQLRDFAGGGTDAAQGAFTARARHVDALHDALRHVRDARAQLANEHLDLGADELRCAHDALGTLTGRVDADALLGHIFSSFCIGK